MCSHLNPPFLCRLWNTTLVEDFPGIHTVKIRSKAHLTLDPSMEITQRIEDDVDYVRIK